MARPKTGRNGKAKKLYLNERLTRNSDKLAYRRNLSLSQLVGNLLTKELADDKAQTA